MSNSQILLSYIGRGSKCAMNGISPALSVGIALILRLGSFWYGAILGFTVYALFKKRIMKDKNKLFYEVENV